MKQSTEMGMNRTGMGMAPSMSKQVIEGAKDGGPGIGDGQNIEQLRKSFLDSSPPVGSVPPPSSLKGLVQTGAQALTGKRPTIFIDKLGERLAFERTGTRMYEALVAKYDSDGSWDGGPKREDLEHFHNEELEHFKMLRDSINELGGDPTVVTPAADVNGVASGGALKVITDPRSSLSESLEALLMVELMDNDAWEMLIDLTRDMGQDDMANRFNKALTEEHEHLSSVRKWLSAGIKQQASITG